MILCSHTRLYAFGQLVESLKECQVPFFRVSLDNLLSSEEHNLLETQNKDIRPMEPDVSVSFLLYMKTYSRRSTPTKQ